MKQLTRETEERNQLLRDEKIAIQKHYQQLKQRIKLYRTTQNQRLLQLSQSANACKKTIQEKVKFACRIIEMSELMRKMETAQEQILPFAPVDITYAEKPALNKSPTNKSKVKEALREASKDESATSAPGQEADGSTVVGTVTTAQQRAAQSQPPAHQASVWALNEQNAVIPTDRLAGFYRKYNKIVLDNVAIAKEKERLVLENTQLQDLISQYIAGTRLSDDVLADDNPLFVVNGRANLNFDPPVRKIAKPTVQDAATIQNTAARQIAW